MATDIIRKEEKKKRNRREVEMWVCCARRCCVPVSFCLLDHCRRIEMKQKEKRRMKKEEEEGKNKRREKQPKEKFLKRKGKMGKHNTRCHSARSRQSSPDRHRLRTTEKLFGKDPKSTIRSPILHRVWFRICVEYHFWLDKEYKTTWQFIWIEKIVVVLIPFNWNPQVVRYTESRLFEKVLFKSTGIIYNWLTFPSVN